MNRSLTKCVIIIIAIFFNCFTCIWADNQIGDYEVHEWGVIVGCDTGANYFLTSRPMQVVSVREPVLYIHSKDKKPFSLKVTFANGVPTETYPVGEKSGKSILWEKITFTDKTRRMRGKREYQHSLAHVPLKNIINTLNDVDADEIYIDGVKSRFLFYEGEMPFANKIEYTYVPENREATVVNKANYSVFDVFVISSEFGKPSFRRNFLSAYIACLKPNEKIKVKLILLSEQPNFTQSLNDLGFTDKEIKTFRSLWERPFLNYGKLVYRLPEEEINKMIKLEFVPRPKKIARTLFVLIR